MPDRKRAIALLLACAVALRTAAPAAGEEAWPQREFVVNVSAQKPDWRPHRAYNSFEAQILSSVYEGLFVYDPYNMDPLPALAESWSTSKDGFQWTFTIRKTARFETGEAITAAMVRDSWLTLLKPEVAAPYASLLDCIAGATDFRTGKNADPASVGIAAPDDRTLVLRLSAPAPHLPKILCHHAFSVVYPTELARAAGPGNGSNYRPVSSGAFRIASETDGEIILAPNSHYWDREHVALPSVKLVFSDDADALTSAFNRGQIDWLAAAANLKRVVGRGSLHITPMFSTEFFFFRSTWGPWADSRVRNALLLAVPWTRLREGNLIPAKTLVYPIAGYPELEGLSDSDPAEAKTLLAGSGFTDLAAQPPLVISIPESRELERLAGVLKEAWTALGFRVEIRVTPYETYYSSLRTDDYAVGLSSWIGDFADPLAFLELFRPSSSLNDSGWASPEFEKLVGESFAASTTKERYERLAEAEKLLLADGVVLPVSHSPAVNVIESDGFEGWYDNPLDIHPFKFIKFARPKPLPGVALRF